MFANAMMKVAVAATPHVNTHDSWAAFGHRLVSNHDRLIACAIVTLIVGIILGKSFQALTALGSFWLVWYIYNTLFPAHATPLFIGERSPNGLFDIMFGGGWGLIATGLAVLVAIGTFRQSSGNIVIRIFGAVAMWASVMLIYSIIIVQWLHLV